jgi:hypothetical protein
VIVLVNNNEINIIKDSLVLNATVFDPFDKTKIGSVASNKFKIPLDSNNKSILGGVDSLLSQSKTVKIEGAEIRHGKKTERGYLLIDSYNHDTSIVTAIFISSEKALFESLDKPLRDFEFSDSDFVFNQAGYDSIKAHTEGIFTFSLAKMADTTYLNNYKLWYHRPFYNVKRLLTLLFEQGGYQPAYELQSGEFSTLENLLITSNHQDFYVSDFEYLFENVSATGNLDFTQGVSQTTFVENSVLDGTTDVLNHVFKTSYVIKGRVYTPNKVQVTIDDEIIFLPKGFSTVNFRTKDFEVNSTVQINFSQTVKLIDVRVFSLTSETTMHEDKKEAEEL